MSDVQYTQYELPIIELELDSESDPAKLELLNQNCFQVMQGLNIGNIMIRFQTRSAIDRWIGLHTHMPSGLNVMPKLKAVDYIYAVEHYEQDLKAYSDVIIEALGEELKDLTLPKVKCLYPMMQVTVQCTEQLRENLDTLIQEMQSVGTVKCILLEPDFRTEIDFAWYNHLIDRIYHMTGDLRIFLERGNYPIQIIRKHPCNVYILSCEHCHSGKKDLPRVFTIQSDGEIFPEGMGKEFKRFAMGNIFEKKLDAILENYRFSPNHLRFKEACKRVYQQFALDYPFSAFPWRYFYVMKAQELLTEVKNHDATC